VKDDDDPGSLSCKSPGSPVDHPVGPPIPEFFHAQEDSGEVSSVVAGEESGDVLQNSPPWATGVHESDVLVHESVELPVESGALASESKALGLADAEILAGKASDEHVGSSHVAAVSGLDIVTPFSGGPVASEDRSSVFVDLHLHGGRHARPVEAQSEAFDPGEQRGVLHGVRPRSW
jgi:hypothetical protein